MYFQYDNNRTPIGFIYNNIQYFYMTNQSGDVVAITYEDGSVFALYNYDAWGKLLSIDTAQENSESQLSIAEANPLRYRGYYFDNETNYYYLQSRYYDANICRFINSDTPLYIRIQVNSFTGINAFVYCGNEPICKYDPEGYYDKSTLLRKARSAYSVCAKVNNLTQNYIKCNNTEDVSYEKKYEVLYLSYTYKYNKNNKSNLGITFIYGKVSSLKKMADDMESQQTKNLGRQTTFISVLSSLFPGLTIDGLILAEVILAIAFTLIAYYSTANNTAKAIKDNVKNKNNSSYHGWVWGVYISMKKIILYIYISIITIFLRELLFLFIIKNNNLYEKYKKRKNNKVLFYSRFVFQENKGNYIIVTLLFCAVLTITFCMLNANTYYDKYGNKYSNKYQVIYYDENNNEYKLDKETDNLTDSNGNTKESYGINQEGYVVDVDMNNTYASGYFGVYYLKSPKKLYFYPSYVYWDKNGVAYCLDGENNCSLSDWIYDDVLNANLLLI